VTAPEPGPSGLVRERTALAWNRSGLAVVVSVAVLLRHLWPLRGAGAYVALGLVAATAIMWAAALLVFATDFDEKRRGAFRGSRPLGLMTVGTVLLAAAAFVLAFFVSP
jgi:hypothetical protein